FIRYAPLVRQRGGTVVVECQPPLVPLLRGCPGIDHLLARGAGLPACDVQVPLLSLPGVFQTTLATVPADVPYLFADAALGERWRRELGGDEAFKVGIAWQGSPSFPGDRLRSIPLTQFAPLARIEGVRLYGLQKGPGREQIRPAPAATPALVDLGERLDEQGAFLDTAAVMKSLDLVVTSDTAIAHLAGALGVPVWVALSVGADWRWLLDREDCPWYPTMRLFRQRRPDDWDEVFERIAAELRRRLALPSDFGFAICDLRLEERRLASSSNPKSQIEGRHPGGRGRTARQDHHPGDQGEAHNRCFKAPQHPYRVSGVAGGPRSRASLLAGTDGPDGPAP